MHSPSQVESQAAVRFPMLPRLMLAFFLRVSVSLVNLVLLSQWFYFSVLNTPALPAFCSLSDTLKNMIEIRIENDIGHA